ncbi:alpha/beta hydrolase [Haloferula sp. BvORR071]|uniref:alpha/beta hydrolase n=1 Tax=Haloferula sp. BvORR071 TaxID=1396141 RepID=UPI0006972C7C|nr:alpha/beta hydrolase [Haloferula sp. BvORR071]
MNPLSPRHLWLGLLALLLPSFASCTMPLVGPVPQGVARERDLRFSPSPWPAPLLADVYHPRDPLRPPAPAVLLIHGGSWKADDDRWTMTPIAKALAKRGYVVVNAGYRGTPGFRYPAPIDDLREAIHWMRRNATRYGIDPTRIAVFGYSAGGHLAAQVALRDGNPEKLRAIVTASAPFDLSLFPDSEDVDAFLGAKVPDIPARVHEASPLSHVTSASPPIFIYQGTADTTVPPEHARRMQAAYRRHGFDTQVFWLEGKGHIGAFLFPGTAMDAAIAFLDQHLKQ